ncbi:MAG TPA: DUF5320 domain-containing protein [Anaerohalosphaeraceae bacterium]|nr:DUF5320 domain-containing protein [Anaerohalosphaeraceae bacterium]
MPGGDRTGPMGQGPMTGRGAGYCAGFGMPGYANPGFGYGMGRGMGRGMGWGMGRGGRGRRNWFWATGLPGWARPGWGMGAYAAGQPMTEQDELEMLKAQSEQMQQNLQQIQQRIDQLQSPKKQ